MYIEQSGMVGIGLYFVDPALIHRVIMLIEKDDMVLMGCENGTHDLAVVLHNRNGFVVIDSVKFELYQELFRYTSVFKRIGFRRFGEDSGRIGRG